MLTKSDSLEDFFSSRILYNANIPTATFDNSHLATPKEFIEQCKQTLTNLMLDKKGNFCMEEAKDLTKAYSCLHWLEKEEDLDSYFNYSNHHYLFVEAESKLYWANEDKLELVLINPEHFVSKFKAIMDLDNHRYITKYLSIEQINNLITSSQHNVDTSKSQIAQFMKATFWADKGFKEESQELSSETLNY